MLVLKKFNCPLLNFSRYISRPVLRGTGIPVASDHSNTGVDEADLKLSFYNKKERSRAFERCPELKEMLCTKEIKYFLNFTVFSFKYSKNNIRKVWFSEYVTSESVRAKKTISNQQFHKIKCKYNSREVGVENGWDKDGS